MRHPSRAVVTLVLAAAALGAAIVAAQSPVRSCAASPEPAWCSAVPGDRAGLAVAAPVGGDGAQRHRRDQPAAGCAGGARRPEARRQRRRRGRRHGGDAQRGRADERRSCAAICSRSSTSRKENKLYALNASGKAPSGADAGADERARLRVGCRQLGTGIGHAVGRHPHGDGAGRGVGLGRSAAPLRHADLQGDAAAGDRLRGAGLSDHRSASPATGGCRSVSAPSPATRAAAARSSIPMRWPPGTSTGVRPSAGQIFRNPGLARTFRLLQQQGRDGFYQGEIAQALVDKSIGARRHDDARRSRDVHRRVGDAGDHHLSRLRRVHAAAAGADLGHGRDPQHPRGVRAEVGAGADAGVARARRVRSTGTCVVEAKKLAFNDLYAFNADPELRRGARSIGCCRRRTRSRCARASTRMRASATTAGGNAPTPAATRSCCRPPTATATWWRGSTACTRRSAPVSPCPATASRCTTAAGCSRSIRRAPT